MGHLNGFLTRGGGNLNTNFSKIQMPGVLPGGGMLNLRFDWYIRDSSLRKSLFFGNIGGWAKPSSPPPPPPPPAARSLTLRVKL